VAFIFFLLLYLRDEEGGKERGKERGRERGREG